MQFRHLLKHHLIDLQMTRLALSFLVHHRDEVAVPVGHFFDLLVVVVETGDVFAAQTAERAVISADDVFYLPHVKQVFCDAFLAKFLCDEHVIL